MKKKYIAFIIIGIVLIAALGAWLFAGHSKQAAEEASITEEDPTNMTEDIQDELLEEQDEGTGIGFEEESDEAVVTIVEKEKASYFGTWTATSDMAHYLYGDIEVTVKENGTWSAVITGEPTGGTWKEVGDHLHMDDGGQLLSFDLAFSDNGNLVMIDTDSDDVVYTVLTKKK